MENRTLTRHIGAPVKITGYDPSTHLVDVVHAVTGEKLEPEMIFEKDVDVTPLYQVDDRRVIKVDDDPEGAVLEVKQDTARLAGDSTTGFYSSKEYGNVIMGPLSIGSLPNRVRLGGITTLNPLLITGFPSTIVSPLPTCIISLPGINTLKFLQKAVTSMSTMIALCGS